MRHYQTCACNFPDLFDSRVIYEKARIVSSGFYCIESFRKIMHETDVALVCEELVGKSEKVPEQHLVEHDHIQRSQRRSCAFLREQR